VPIYEHHWTQILESALRAGKISYTSEPVMRYAGRCNFYLCRNAAKEHGDADFLHRHVADKMATEARSSKLGN